MPTEDLEKRFKEADTEGKGHLNFKDFQKFVKLLKARPELSRCYKKLCVDGQFTFDVFQRFMRETQKSTASQQELERIFIKFATKSSKSTDSISDPLTKSPPLVAGSPPSLPQPTPLSPSVELIHLPTEPGPRTPIATRSDPLSTPSLDTRVSLASISEGETVTSPVEDAPSMSSLNRTWSLGAFTAFLLSADNSPFSDYHSKIWQDMTRPLSEYFISSSHNTYLVGNQLMGDSTIEGYIRALLHSCRSVELDIYDGDHEPVVYHGRTLTSKVLLRDICNAIAKYAFVASPYPIIISAEVHCNLEQQSMIAQIFKNSFGDMLVQAPINNESVIEQLPSPEDLKHRVLLKAKNLYIASSGIVQQKEITVDAQSSSTESTSSESEPAKELRELEDEVKKGMGRARSLVNRAFGRKKKSTDSQAPAKVKMSVELVALLVYTVGVKCRGFNKKENYAIEHVFSLSEKTANKILKESVADLVKHNRTHVVRIYPNGTRLSSSNFEPHRYWAAGAQLVAINWQTFDLGYMINHTMFERNGRSGYVLKPEALRLKDKEVFAKRTNHFLDITVISAQQLPRPRDDTGREILGRSIIDPFVEVSVHIPDWSTSPFLPEQPVNYSPASGPSTSAGTAAVASSARAFTLRTSTVKNNGFNPVWEEKISLPFDCVGNMKDMIFVRFTVKAEKMDNTKSIAVYCVSLGSLEQGYRHLPLHDQQMSQFLFSTLFVHISIRDA
jgi:phosphatidylinositol phospholipase C delta